MIFIYKTNTRENLTLEHMFVFFFVFFLNIIKFSEVVYYIINVILMSETWYNAMDIGSALWILMAWCFSTRTSLTTTPSKHPCVSSYLWVHPMLYNGCNYLPTLASMSINVVKGTLYNCLPHLESTH